MHTCCLAGYSPTQHRCLTYLTANSVIYADPTEEDNLNILGCADYATVYVSMQPCIRSLIITGKQSSHSISTLVLNINSCAAAAHLVLQAAASGTIADGRKHGADLRPEKAAASGKASMAGKLASNSPGSSSVAGHLFWLTSTVSSMHCPDTYAQSCRCQAVICEFTWLLAVQQHDELNCCFEAIESKQG